jgi:hypothetical protein
LQPWEIPEPPEHPARVVTVVKTRIKKRRKAKTGFWLPHEGMQDA